MITDPRRARCAALLDTIARTTTRSEVALHALAAADALGVAASPDDVDLGEHAALAEVLALLAGLTADASHDDDLADATHHALLAHIATRPS